MRNAGGRLNACILLTAIVASGCMSKETDPAERLARFQKNEVSVGVVSDEFGLLLNRHRIGIYPLNASICEPPFRLAPTMTTEPSLSTGAEYRGGNTFRLDVRRNVTFHDGTPLSARDLKETLEIAIRLRSQYSFLAPESIRIVDDSTLDLTPVITNMRLIEQLAHPTYSVTSAGSDPYKKPMCTGPFQFVEYVPGNHITVKRYGNYWGQKAQLERLTFRFIPDDNTRALALRAGEVDVIYDVNRAMVRSLRNEPGIKIVTSEPGSVLLMHIATSGTPPFTIMSDPSVRRAVAMSIDRRLLTQQILEGLAAPVNSVNPPLMLGRHAELVRGIGYDPQSARRTLDSAGWKIGRDGFRANGTRPLVLTLISQSGVVEKAVNEFVQAQLALVGIKVRIEQLEAGAYTSKLNSGRFDLDLEVPNQNDGNPAFLLALRWYSKSIVRNVAFMRGGQRFDSLVSASLAAREKDDAQRFAAEAMHDLVDVQAAAIPLAGLFRIYAMSTRIRGFEAHPSRLNQKWNTVWIAK